MNGWTVTDLWDGDWAKSEPFGESGLQKQFQGHLPCCKNAENLQFILLISHSHWLQVQLPSYIPQPLDKEASLCYEHLFLYLCLSVIYQWIKHWCVSVVLPCWLAYVCASVLPPVAEKPRAPLLVSRTPAMECHLSQKEVAVEVATKQECEWWRTRLSFRFAVHWCTRNRG